MTFVELVALLKSLANVSGEQEGLSELDHGLQCAFELTTLRADDAELQIAGLLHDIGHQFGREAEHGRIGADQVRGILGNRVAGLIESHVLAKRFLVAFDPSYAALLSQDSTTSLVLQGGALRGDEIAAFSASPFADDAVLLRRCDDRAKIPHRKVPGLDHWLEILEHNAVI